jgi:hypothetical protein
MYTERMKMLPYALFGMAILSHPPIRTSQIHVTHYQLRPEVKADWFFSERACLGEFAVDHLVVWLGLGTGMIFLVQLCWPVVRRVVRQSRRGSS